jgi:hypothetical protein
VVTPIEVDVVVDPVPPVVVVEPGRVVVLPAVGAVVLVVELVVVVLVEVEVVVEGGMVVVVVVVVDVGTNCDWLKICPTDGAFEDECPPNRSASGRPAISSTAVTNIKESTNTMAAVPAMADQGMPLAAGGGGASPGSRKGFAFGSGRTWVDDEPSS